MADRPTAASWVSHQHGAIYVADGIGETIKIIEAVGFHEISCESEFLRKLNSGTNAGSLVFVSRKFYVFPKRVSRRHYGVVPFGPTWTSKRRMRMLVRRELTTGMNARVPKILIFNFVEKVKS